VRLSRFFPHSGPCGCPAVRQFAAVSRLSASPPPFRRSPPICTATHGGSAQAA